MHSRSPISLSSYKSSDTTSSPLKRYSLALSPLATLPNIVAVNPLVKYVISAEFDNRIGAVIKHQIPKKVPGQKEYLSHIGELMIPNNIEHTTKEDFSVFIGYKNSSGKFSLVPDSDTNLAEQYLLLQKLSLHEMDTIFEPKDHEDDILFFFSAVKVVRESGNDRGSIIKSIAVATPLRNYVIFKPMLTASLQNYIYDGKISHLISLFNVCNSIDVSLWQEFNHYHTKLQRILYLNTNANQKLVIAAINHLSSKSNNKNIRLKASTIQYFSDYSGNDITDKEDQILTKIPLNFSLGEPSDLLYCDLNQSHKILAFLNKFSHQLKFTEFRNFNIIVFSKENNDSLCQFISMLSNYMNGFNKPFFSNDVILYQPLVELYSFEDILGYDKVNHNMKILGTNNLVLKDEDQLHHFFYDLDTETLSVNQKKVKLRDNNNIITTNSFIGLTNELLNYRHDTNTVMVSMKRYTILEILRILKIAGTENSELSLRDHYLKNCKNIVLFDEFFEFKSITMIELLDTIFGLISNLDRGQLDDEGHAKLASSYATILETISLNVGGSAITFIYLLEIFPIHVEKPKDIIYDSDQIQNSLNVFFKPLFYSHALLQKELGKIYSELAKDKLINIFLNEKLNLFTKIGLEKYLSSDYA